MMSSLFKRARRGRNEAPQSSAASPALPDAADLHVTLRTGVEPPVCVHLHRMSIRGADIVLPFQLAPMDGSVAELEIRHIKDRWTVTPGVSIATRTIDCWRWVSAAGSVLPIRIKISQRGSSAPVVHHLRPVMT